MKKYVIFGCGQYFMQIIDKYYIPKEDVFCFIDNGLRLQGFFELGGVKLYSWDEYLGEERMSDFPVIIVAKARVNDIENIILESGYRGKIIFCDEWVKGLTIKSEDLCVSIKEQIKRHNQLINQEVTNQNKFRDARLFYNREQCLYSLPSNIVAAEIGVAFGDFTRKIMKIVNPSKMYAIDMFSDYTTGFWGIDIFKEEGVTHYEWYSNNFKEEIENGSMEIRRGLSWDILEEFEDSYFDYVYLDAAHDFDSVSRDISVLKRKVKKGGLIQFNDYTYVDGIGVIPAVNNYLNETNSVVQAYCLSTNGYDDILIRNL